MQSDTGASRRRDRGSISTEYAVAMPILILMVLLPMQFALYWHAKSAANLAAEECAAAAAAYDGSVADGREAADSILNSGGGVAGRQIVVDRDGVVATCHVSGTQAYTVVGSYNITARAQAGIERFVTGETP